MKIYIYVLMPGKIESLDQVEDQTLRELHQRRQELLQEVKSLGTWQWSRGKPLPAPSFAPAGFWMLATSLDKRALL